MLPFRLKMSIPYRVTCICLGILILGTVFVKGGFSWDEDTRTMFAILSGLLLAFGTIVHFVNKYA